MRFVLWDRAHFADSGNDNIKRIGVFGVSRDMTEGKLYEIYLRQS